MFEQFLAWMFDNPIFAQSVFAILIIALILAYLWVASGTYLEDEYDR